MMNKETHELLGFLKGIRFISVYCDQLLKELEGASISIENVEYEGGIQKVKEFCEEQIVLYQALVKKENKNG